MPALKHCGVPRFCALNGTIVLCLALSLMTAATPVAQASVPGDNGRIVYAAPAEGYGWYEIWVMTSDGSEAKQITHDGGTFVGIGTDDEGNQYDLHTSNWRPVWRPDTQRIAYLHRAGLDRIELRDIDPDGMNMKVLVRDWNARTAPSWSPIGERMAFGDDAGLWVGNGDGSNPQLIAPSSRGQWPYTDNTRSETIDVAWSPDGEHIAFVESTAHGLVAGETYLSIVNADGGNRKHEVCMGVFSIDWAPDAASLLCAGYPYHVSHPEYGEGILEIAANGHFRDHLRNDGMWATWSPDGSTIMYRNSLDLLRTTHLATMRRETLGDAFEGYWLGWQARRGTFWDDDDSVFEADIEWMASTRTTRGCDAVFEDRYCPGGHTTRGQMAAFLVRALKLPAAPSAGFVDTVGTTFEQDIDRLAAAGITKGCNPPANDRFCPDDNVRREVMAAFLVRALGYNDDGGGGLFDDTKGSIFATDIDKLATAGVTKGCNPPTNDRFCPTSNVTRGQMAAFLHRALG